MKLRSIKISNFRVFDNFEFEFPQQGGLYLIAGENRDRPELGSNGVGKSSLWDAVCFALYGESTRRLKGGELLRDNETDMAVRLDCDIGVIERTWSTKRKVKIELNGKEINQDELQKAVAIERDLFVATTIIPQATPMFLDLPPTAQVAVLQRLLGLERWLKYAEKAAARTNVLEKVQASVEGQLRGVESALAGMASLEDLRQRALNWDNLHKDRITTLEKAFSDAHFAANRPNRINQLKVACERGALVRRLESNISVMTRRNNETQTKHSEVNRALAVREAEVQETTKRIEWFDKNPICPTCNQPITDQHKTACLSVLSEKALIARNAMKELTELFDSIKKDLVEGTKTLHTAQATLRGLEQSLSTAQRELAVEEGAVQQRAQACRAAEHALEAERLVTNPMTAALERAEQQQKELETNIDRLRAQVKADEANTESHRVWTKGFKAIRSQLVSDGLQQLSIEITAVLEDLGLLGWSVLPRIDPSVFESAKITTGFGFAITDPLGVERSIEAYSGGELQRVRLAVQLGLGALVADTAEVEVGFEVFDEPSSYLSEEGVLGVFQALHNRAQRLQRPIFVIDHHQAHYGEISKTYTLIREGDRARIAV